MKEKEIKKGKLTFQSEGRLLQELGERLVASPEVALVELIKNAYDADSPECHVNLVNEDTLEISDNGHGITLDEFENRWMRIATGGKEKEQLSRKFKRRLTGAKGIGRFAVRFIGGHLRLESVSASNSQGIKTKIIAEFDWREFDTSANISDVEIPYRLVEVDRNTATGTTLIINRLQIDTKDVYMHRVRSEVMKIVSPISGLERGKFNFLKKTSEKTDPGFNVIFSGYKGDKAEENLAKEVLENYWLRVTISLEGEHLKYKVFRLHDTQPIFKHEQKYPTDIVGGIFVDIRHFPRRGGIFQNKGFNGRQAWSWIRENSGIGVVDHGFRIKPYGYADDDWLNISEDHARNRRLWRSSILKEQYPMTMEQIRIENQNLMLYLPANHQLVGAVFLESRHQGISGSNKGLIASMDREGYLNNNAFKELSDIVRAGVEFLAREDKREQDRIAEEEARLETEKVREDIKSAIKIIQDSKTLNKSDKTRIVKEYANLAQNIDEVDDYQRKARQGLEIMSLLGVIAGFMTHESDRILYNLEQAIDAAQKIASQDETLRVYVEKLRNSHVEIKGQIEYSRTFIASVHSGSSSSFKAFPQVQRILKKFGDFAVERGVELKVDIDKNLMTPKIPIALYSGILLNLYTNALKSVIAREGNQLKPKVVFQAWNESNKHIIQVLDNGVGIPEELKDRIWDPLFTTTSNTNNPLGSGMGLGLSLVKKLMRDLGGSIRLVEPPSEFKACFRVEFPLI